MKKLVILFIICMFFISIGNVYAEPYKGKGFPSDQQLKNMIWPYGLYFSQSIGKYRNPDGSYTLFYKGCYEQSGSCEYLRRAIILRLDSGIWIVYMLPREESYKIIQK